VGNLRKMNKKKKITTIAIVFLVIIWGIIFVSSLRGLVGSYPVPTVLASIAGKYTQVVAYIASTGQWKTYVVGEPINPLENMTPTMGYWIYVNQTGGVNLTINGTQLSNTTWVLYQGWNLIGYPSLTTRNVSNALSTIDGNYTQLVVYIASTGQWKTYVVGEPINPLENMTPGYGYWIYVNTSTATLTI
jgi:hypothetical protein